MMLYSVEDRPQREVERLDNQRLFQMPMLTYTGHAINCTRIACGSESARFMRIIFPDQCQKVL
jgi:hypothetical protein